MHDIRLTDMAYNYAASQIVDMIRITMFSRLWSVPPTTSAVFQQLQHELEQMQDRFGEIFKLMLTADPRSVAQTPADVVYSEGKLRLLRYRPVVDRLAPLPLLIVPALINR